MHKFLNDFHVEPKAPGMALQHVSPWLQQRSGVALPRGNMVMGLSLRALGMALPRSSPALHKRSAVGLPRAKSKDQQRTHLGMALWDTA